MVSPYRNRGGMLNTGRDLTFALRRVMFWAKGKPDDVHIAMYNPENLKIDIGYTIVEKSPVGWSGQIRQGTGTIEKPFEVELLYTQRGLKEQPTMDMQKDLDWLGSFCYPKKPGEGPDALCLSWPHTYKGVGRISNLSYEFMRWDTYLRVRRSRITMTFHPYRMSFRSSASFKAHGFREGTTRSSKSLDSIAGPPVKKGRGVGDHGS